MAPFEYIDGAFFELLTYPINCSYCFGFPASLKGYILISLLLKGGEFLFFNWFIFCRESFALAFILSSSLSSEFRSRASSKFNS